MTNKRLPSTPYRGIEAFRYVDEPIFFAREKEKTRLVRRVTIYRTMLCFGDSGAGKSSLINAAFIPGIQAEGFIPHRIRVQPLKDNEIVVERVPVSEKDGPPYLPSIFCRDEKTSVVTLSLEELATILKDSSEQNVLLIFDQFEEFITLFEEAQRGRAKIVAARNIQLAIQELLVRLIKDESQPLKLLFVFREDYLAKLSKLFSLFPTLMDHSLRVTPPPVDSLESIISKPFFEHPNEFRPELSKTLRQTLVCGFQERSLNGTINLTEVQIVCLRLWQAPNPEELLADRKIEGILEDHLQDALKSLGSLQTAAIALLTWMVTPVGTRNIISDDDLLGRVVSENKISENVAKQALDTLVEKTKLVKKEPRSETYFYSIVSESLIDWIGVERKRLKAENVDRRLREARERLTKERCYGAGLTIILICAGLAFYWLAGERSQRESAQKLASLEIANIDALRDLRLADDAFYQLYVPNGSYLALLFAARVIEHAVAINGSNHVEIQVPPRALLALGCVTAIAQQNPNSLPVTSQSSNRPLGDVTAALENLSRYLPAITSPDGKTTITIGKNNQLEVWDETLQNKHVLPLDAGNRGISKMGFSWPDAKRFAIQVASKNKEDPVDVFVWDIKDLTAAPVLHEIKPQQDENEIADVLNIGKKVSDENRSLLLKEPFKDEPNQHFVTYDEEKTKLLFDALKNVQVLGEYARRNVPLPLLSLRNPDDVLTLPPLQVAQALQSIINEPVKARELIRKAAISLGVQEGDLVKALANQKIEEGNAAAASGDRNAIADYRAAIAINPFLENTLDPDTQFKAFNDSASKVSTQAQSFVRSGNEMALSGNIEGAEKAYNNAKKLAPDYYASLNPETEAKRIRAQASADSGNLASPPANPPPEPSASPPRNPTPTPPSPL